MDCNNPLTYEYNGVPLYAIILLTILGIFLFVVLILELFLLPKKRKKFKLEEDLLTHVVITGGSSGIGLSVARLLIKKRAKHITLLARNEAKLKQVTFDLQQYANETSSTGSPTTIKYFSVDVSDAQKIQKVAKDVCENKTDIPIPTALINVAGIATSAAFVDTNYSEFERLMSINYLGSAYTTRAFLPYMRTTSSSQPKAIQFTSSQAGQIGIYGFTAYSASKFALRGMAEALQMEVQDDNVRVQVVFPPDTDTPGFEIENLDKPEITRLLSETSGLFSAEAVAKRMVDDMLKTRPPFHVYIGLDGWLLSGVSAGMSPLMNIVDGLYQIFLGGLLRFVSLFYLWDFRNTVRKQHAKAKKK